jgi:hypothetical protein
MAKWIFCRIYTNTSTCPDTDELMDEEDCIVVKTKDWTPGLAVTTFRGRTTVTHRSSGLSCCGALDNRAHALAVMERIDPLTDWTLDKETVGAADIGAEVRRIVEETRPTKKKERVSLPRRAAVEKVCASGPWKGATAHAKYLEGQPVWVILHPSGGWALLFMDEVTIAECKDLLEAEAEKLKNEVVNEARNAA